MFKLPDFPRIDLSKFDLSKIDLPKFDLPKFDLPTIDDKLTAAIRDAAYITVGLGVVAVERTQARRQQLIAGISERFGANKAHVETLLGAVEARVARLDERARDLFRPAA